MGGSQSGIISNRWQFVVRVDNFYSLVRDKRGREGQEYRIIFRADAILAEQLSIYNFRRSSPQQIVSVYDSEFKNDSSLCSTSNWFRVITEHLCIRFNQPFSLNLQQIVYLLTQAVKGYQFLYSKVGCFAVTDRMMGLTSEGQLRVWMHQSFAQNIAQFTKNSIKTVSLSKYSGVNQQQSFMIHQILKIIEKHTERTIFQRYFRKLVAQNLIFASFNAKLAEIQLKMHIPSIQRVDLIKKDSNLI